MLKKKQSTKYTYVIQKKRQPINYRLWTKDRHIQNVKAVLNCFAVQTLYFKCFEEKYIANAFDSFLVYVTNTPSSEHIRP